MPPRGHNNGIADQGGNIQDDTEEYFRAISSSLLHILCCQSGCHVLPSPRTNNAAYNAQQDGNVVQYDICNHILEQGKGLQVSSKSRGGFPGGSKLGEISCVERDTGNTYQHNDGVEQHTQKIVPDSFPLDH